MKGRLDLGQERVWFTGCPHDIEKRAEAELSSHQNLRPPVGMNIIEASLIDYADDRIRPIITPQPDTCAYSIAYRKEMSGNGGINDDFGQGILTELRESTAGDQSHAHDLDVVRAHGDNVGKHLVPLWIAGVPGRAGNCDRPLTGCRRERQRRGGARPGDTGNRGQRALEAIPECVEVTRLGEELVRRPHPNGKYAIRSEARIRTQQPLEAAHHEGATAQEYERERHLRHDQASAPAALSAAADRAASQKRR